MENPTGKLSLKFRQKENGKTYLAEQYFKLPLQIMPPYYQDGDGTAFVYLLNPSGGILQHDRLYTEISVEENAKVLVTTPAGTKFYKMDDGYAVLENEMRVERGGVLEYIPEHSVPFAGSRTYQENRFYLHEDAVLIAADMVTAGRVSRGEVYQYDLYAQKTKIYGGGKLIAYDHSILQPEKMNIKGIGMMEGFGSNATMYLYKKGIGSALAANLNDAAHGEGMRFGASAAADSLVVVRLIGENIIDMQETMQTVWNLARLALLGKESVRIRKY